MSEFEFRFREIERRISKVEEPSSVVPVIQRDIAAIKEDLGEVRDENRAMRRAFYSLALSIVGSSVLFAITVNELFK